MSLDIDCYNARRRQQYSYRQDDKTMPISQQIISWGIAIGFIFLVCDHGWWKKAIEDKEERGDYPGTPQYEQALKELATNNDELKKRLASGTITPEETAKFQYKGIECLSRMGNDWSNFSSGMYQEAEEIYTKNWKVDDRDGWMKLHCKTEADRRAFARWDFEQKFQEARCRLPRPECLKTMEFKAETAVRLVYWIVKWYFLMTIPAFLIMLVGKRYDGLSIKEELLLQPARLAYACLAGPIGAFSLSGVAAKISCYRRLEQQFLKDKPWGFQISERQKEALWVQVYKPLLTFDQALESLKEAGGSVRKPVTACVLVWILSLTYHHSGFQTNECYLQTITLNAPAEEELSFTNENTPTKRIPSSLENLIMLALLPGIVVTWPREKSVLRIVKLIVQLVQPFGWSPDKPRGPPNSLVREKSTSTTLCLSELAIVTEG